MGGELERLIAVEAQCFERGTLEEREREEHYTSAYILTDTERLLRICDHDARKLYENCEEFFSIRGDTNPLAYFYGMLKYWSAS